MGSEGREYVAAIRGRTGRNHDVHTIRHCRRGVRAGAREIDGDLDQLQLDDRRIADDPVRLAAMVFALENLAAAGDANTIERVAQRLRSLPLTGDSRQRLDALLARSLPGGSGGR